MRSENDLHEHKYQRLSSRGRAKMCRTCGQIVALSPEELFIDEVVEKAEVAFWDVVAKSYPEAKYGDFPPLLGYNFSEACREAIETWVRLNVLDWNVKEEGK